ncbi:CapA family protein [Streptomyces sp. NPDC000880]
MTRRTRQGPVAATVVLLTAAAGCAGQSDPAHAPPSRQPGATAPSAASGAQGAARAFTLVASGGVLPHESVIRQAKADADGEGYDFRPILAGVRAVVSGADLAICHIETVYGEKGDYTGYPAFKTPPQIAKALASTGYDSCSTASNHTLDDGAAGVHRTLDALDTAGIKHAGSARTSAEARSPAWLKAGGAKVAQLAYTFGTNYHALPEGQPWAVNLIDEKKIVGDARAARQAGADVVVVSLHWGTQWQTEPDEQQLTLGRRLTAATTVGRPDIDLILGTHAHVPQAYEKVNGTWIIYGLGDQIAGTSFSRSGDGDSRGNQGSIGRFTFAPPAKAGERWPVTKAEFVPQWMDAKASRVISLSDALRRGADRDDYREAQALIREAVLGRGAAKDGLTMGR